MVRHERARRGAAVDRLQHRRLDLDEAGVVEEAPDRGDHLGARDEHGARLLAGHQVELAVAVAGLDVGEPVVLVGRRAQRLRQQREVVELERELAAARCGRRSRRRRSGRRGRGRAAAPSAPRRARRRARGAASCPSGRPRRGTRPCPVRGARPGARRCGRARRSPRRRRASSCGALTRRSARRPGTRAGTGRSRRRAAPRACAAGRAGPVRARGPRQSSRAA